MKKLLLLTGALLSATPVFAQDTSLAAKFGALETVQQISLSPDGNKVAFVSPQANGSQLVFVVDLAGDATPKAILSESRPEFRLRRCHWATDIRLVCEVTVLRNEAGDLLGFSRLFSMTSEGKDIKQLTAGTTMYSLYRTFYGGDVIDWDLPGKPGKVLMMRSFVPQESTGSIIRREDEGLGVEEVDVATLRRTTVERARSEAQDYISDGHGTVRIMGLIPRDSEGYMRNRMSYSYRPAGSREWTELSKLEMDDAGGGWRGFLPYAVDSAKNVAYGFDDNGGYRALYTVALDGSRSRQIVLSRPDVDIGGLVRIGRDQRVVGATYATDTRKTEFFDPELKKLGKALGAALPGKPTVSFVDTDANEKKLLLVADSDVDPGMVYLYEKGTRRLAPLLPIRAPLAGMALGKMQPITYPAADGTQIPGYLTLPPGSDGKGLPAIVMPHGGPSARDEWGFDWLAQYFAARGYAVIQPNYRGSSGYGAAWYRKNGFQGWRTAIGDVDDAGRWLLKQGIAAPGKLAIVGWSYGGYAALQGAVLDPKLFKAVVAIAPVTDLGRLRADGLKYANYAFQRKFIGDGPHIREGSPAQNASAIQVPVLMFHGDRDQNVPIDQSRFMADQLRDAHKEVRLVEFPGLSHSLVDATVRTRVLSESDAFLRKALDLPPG